MNFFDYFQVAIIALIVCVIAGKAAYLRVTTGINPFVIGRATEGAWRIVELLALASLVVWLVEVVLHALRSPYDMFPDRVELALLYTQPVRILGATLAGIGFVVFVLAFFSFGDSWRIGIDRKTAGTLVTGGIFSISRNP
ncbi:MAG TPA: hypothetical protein VGQ72_08845, partial [Pyrinomonadaceae bacterium]|nr:hypothetical protein [Pyrinomonadaceae bacterium]